MCDHVVALFSGAGGLSLGFSRAGLKPVFAADIDADACATYSANIGTNAHVLDLGSKDNSDTYKLLSPYRNCFAVVGGPPCQGFSTAGARRSDDPRNRLVFHYLDIVDYLNPRWFLFENVEGILTSNGGTSICDLLSCFIDRGYTVRLEKINFAAYGLPQSRKRVVVIGNRVGAKFNLPCETNSFSSGKHKSINLLPRSPSLIDAIGDLPHCLDKDGIVEYQNIEPTAFGALMRAGNSGGVAHHYVKEGSYDLERISLLKPGQTMRDLPEELWHPSFHRRAYRRVMDGTPTERRGGPPSGVKRLHAEECSLTITSAASREFIHPKYDRPLTLREAARLQSFPDWYEFHGKQSAIATQIGNAVSPMIAEIFARHIASLDSLFGSGMTKIPLVNPGLLGFRLTDALGKSPALQQTETLLQSLPIVGREERARLYGT